MPPLRRPAALDLLAGALLLAGVLLVATGALPSADAEAMLDRALPLLVFLAGVVVLAELLAAAEVFDVVATRMAIAAGGSYPRLFGLCVLLASVTTAFLNLDTTAVLLTPVMVAVAGRSGAGKLPLAMTTVWFANLASLLLPVSNLTNLLAADRIGLPARAFASRMWLPQLAAIAVGAACLWFFHWRGQDRYHPPEPVRPGDRVLFGLAAVDAAAFAAAVVAGVPLPAAAVAAAVVIVVAYAVRRRDRLTVRLVPLRLLVLVIGLFLVLGAADRTGFGDFLRSLVGDGIWRTAGTGAVLANLVNNLPAYVAVEAAVPAGHADQLLALLIGVNVGPLVLPWGSLATVIWFERVRAAGVTVDLRRFVLTGLATALLTIAAAVSVLALTGGQGG
ncbi:MAG TPA: SLC13 family permease [Mycobacteriales bacterium]|nr:SLC13 family permease [Mycobacteriales bacterium]